MCIRASYRRCGPAEVEFVTHACGFMHRLTAFIAVDLYGVRQNR
jgi:hypothetical protein